MLVVLWESRTKKRKNCCTAAEIEVLTCTERILQPPGSMQKEGRSCPRHGAKETCSTGQTHGAAGCPPAAHEHHME